VLLLLVLSISSGAAIRLEFLAQAERGAKEAALEAQRTAEASAVEAQRALDVASERLAENYWQRGQIVCEAGQIEQGLLLMVRALETLPPDRPELEYDIRTSLTGWQARLTPVLCAVPHADHVTCAAFYSNGSQFLTGCSDGTARAWHVASGEPCGPPLQHGSRVSVVAVSPDNKIAVSGSDDGTIQYFDAISGKRLGDKVACDAPIMAADFTADSSKLVVATNRSIHLHDVATQAPSDSKLAIESHGGVTKSLDVAGGLMLIAIGSRVQPLNLTSGEQVGPGLNHSGIIRAAALQPEGRLAASGGTGRSLAQLWNIDTGTVIAEVPTGNLPVTYIAWSADGKKFAIANQDGTVTVWNDEGKPIRPPIRHRGHVNALAFNSNATAIITGCRDGTARVWDLVNADASVLSLKHDGPVYRVGFRHDGSRAITGSDDGNARVWDPQSGAMIGTPLPHGAAVRAIAFSPDGKSILTGGIDHQMRVWNAETQQLLGNPIRCAAQVYQVAFLPEGKLFLCATGGYPNAKSGVAEFRSVTSGALSGNPLNHQSGVQCLDLSADGAVAITGSMDNTARLWNVEKRQSIGQVMPHDGYVLAATFAPDGEDVLTGGRDFVARLWNAKTGKPLKAFQHQGSVWGVAFSTNGALIATACDDGGARLWNRKSGRMIGPVLKHDGMVAAVAFNPANSKMLTGGGDSSAKLWNVPEPMAGTTETISLRIQAMTGRFLNSDDAVIFLDGAQWLKVRKQLDMPDATDD
jgi:WD40 repeat protein